MTDKKIRQEVIDELMKGDQGPEDFPALITSLKKALVERVLNAELSTHLGYEKGPDKPEDQSNHRNGSSSKTVLSESGAVQIEIPRDRAGSFEPEVHQERPAAHRWDG